VIPFGLGPTEMIICLVIAVLLFGKRLPEVGRSIGKGMMEFKKGLNDIKSEVDSATSMEPTQSVTKRYNADDYDEPTAPKFEPPAQEPAAEDSTAQASAAEEPTEAPPSDTTAQV
jgi:sec-independent protein translocase protein TatA